MCIQNRRLNFNSTHCEKVGNLALGSCTNIQILKISNVCTVKLGNKEQFDKKQIGTKEPFPVTNLPFTS